MRFGFLSTIDNPLLPYHIASALNVGISDVIVILDERTLSEKTWNIWNERTGGAFESANGGHASIYKLGTARIPFYFVENHNNAQTLDLIRGLDIHCLFNAGTPRKLSAELIRSVSNGVLNVHPGLLPRYRGCCAVEWAIHNDDMIGNTAHFMDEDYDTGPIIMSEWYEYPNDADYVSIRVRTYRDACILAARAMQKIEQDNLTPEDAIA